MTIYTQLIIKHFKHPHNFGTIQSPTHHIHDSNPLCGDTFDIYAEIKDNVIQNITFNGHGCAIATAAASLITDSIKGKNLNEINLSKEYILKLLDVKLNTAREKCAMLPLNMIKKLQS